MKYLEKEDVLQDAKVNNKVETAEAETTSVEPISETPKEVSKKKKGYGDILSKPTPEDSKYGALTSTGSGSPLRINRLTTLRMDGSLAEKANNVHRIIAEELEKQVNAELYSDDSLGVDKVVGDTKISYRGLSYYDPLTITRGLTYFFKKNGTYAQGVKVTVKVEVNNF
jgi:hypothetical protein